MSPITKYEAVGIFMSVAVMALALSLIRFKTDTFLSTQTVENAPATVVVATEDDSAIREAITNKVTPNGVLQGLIVEDVKKGTGESVVEGDTVRVHYIGTLRDGTQFDNSYLRGEPFTFTVGDGKVIEGWEKGLVGMQAGGQRILVIPADMAYGNREVGPIPANSPLVFAVELIGIE